MQREDIKSYKDACKIINRKPRRYRDNHINISVLIYDLQQVVVQNMLKQLLKYYYVSGLILILLNSKGQHSLSSLYV